MWGEVHSHVLLLDFVKLQFKPMYNLCLSLSPFQANCSFFESLQRMTGQPRSLQHLCRCSLRSYLGGRCLAATNELNIPSSLRDYLLLCLEGEIR